MNSFEKPNISKNENQILREKLKEERKKDGSIYQIARYAQMLKLRGDEINLKPKEKQFLLKSLNEARKGNQTLIAN